MAGVAGKASEVRPGVPPTVPPLLDVQAPEVLGLLACASGGDDTCDGMGRWTVRASFTEGDGTVTISAYCGSTSVASCGTKVANTHCEDVGDSGTGTVSCVILVDGDVASEDIVGECVDPLDPTRVVAPALLRAEAAFSVPR
jgi:hypothetical protein